MDYTAIGDTVNTASRLEGKAMAREILISEQVYEALKDRIRVTEKGMIPLKGKAKGNLCLQCGGSIVEIRTFLSAIFTCEKKRSILS